MGVIEKIISKAKELTKRIVLPESEDERVLKAAELIIRKKIGEVTLLGNEEEIRVNAKKINVNLENIEIIDPKKYDKIEIYSEKLAELRSKKGMTIDQAKKILETEPRYFGAMMVRFGDADGMVAGSNSPTSDVIRSAIHVIGTKKGIRTVSSSFLMVIPKKEFGDNGVMMYTDCGVVPNPTADQLADIAESASELGVLLADMEPRVGLLSFSTKGSAKHESVEKVIKACEILKERNVKFEFDGELQADAALVPAIGAKKAPGSKVAGNANILVFPDLNAGNISYKLTQRLTGGEAYGPLLQGLAKPVNDLSRGCSVEDIVNVAAITIVESK